jgi:hypothetical protein
MLMVSALTLPATRHQPRLCAICRAPLSRQEDACWHCSAPLSHEHFSGGQRAAADTARRPPRRPVLSARFRRRAGASPIAATPGRRAAESGSARAADRARRQRERAEARRHVEQLERQLASAIDAGDVRCRRLQARLDDFDTRLAATRLRLCQP